ncbi:hypothetical protein Tco_0189736 [Tanacetum coccineum]
MKDRNFEGVEDLEFRRNLNVVNAFGGVGDEEVIVGKGVVVISSSLGLLKKLSRRDYGEFDFLGRIR